MMKEKEWKMPNLAIELKQMLKKINSENLNDIRKIYIDLLLDYMRSINELIINKYEVNINYDIKEIENNINSVYDRELNICEFLRMLNNIIKIPKRKLCTKIEKLFYLYIDTLNIRFVRLLDVIEGRLLETYEDRFEDDKSVLNRNEYENELYELQIQLNRLQKHIQKHKLKVAILFEGRDAAGKGSTIKRVAQYLPTKSYDIVTLGVPSNDEMNRQNWFDRYEKHMPKEGEIVFFDRSWYNMAIVNPVMGYCTTEQYDYFMENVNDFENKLLDNNIILIKLWFSISQKKQLQRFENRKKSELKYWKFSINDMKSVEKWDIYTKYKEDCFNKTSTYKSPWVIINSNDKKISRLNCIRYLLSKFNFIGKDKLLSEYYPDIVYELK